MKYIKVQNRKKRNISRVKPSNSKRFKRDKSAFWVWTPNPRSLYGPFKSYSEANREGLNTKVRYKVEILPTINQSKASQIMKAKLLKSGNHGISDSLRRLKHRR